MDPKKSPRDGRCDEAGFTLVETLVAIVVLVFGLMAVTNLLLVAATSNTVANQATAAASSASEVMDMLRSTAWSDLPVGGSLTADTTSPAPDCRTMARPTLGTPFYNCDDNVAGVGVIKVRWQVTAGIGTVRLLQISVAGEGQGALSGARSRAVFTTYRSCTESRDNSCGTGVTCCLTD